MDNDPNKCNVFIIESHVPLLHSGQNVVYRWSFLESSGWKRIA